jgi:ribonuclease D
MTAYQTIDTDEKLTAFGRRLKERHITTLAMDFEGEFNLHAYGEKLCLVQIFDGKEFFVIDPFTVSADALKTFLEDRKVLKLFFGAGSDVQLVYKESKNVLNSVLDLQILAEVAGCKNQGLSGLNEELFGTVTLKKKQFQMHNWTRRPIDPEAVDYALSDVALLFDMHRVLLDRILKAGKADEMIRALVLKTPSSFSRGVPGIYRSVEFQAFGPDDKARFERIVAVREALAKRLDWPPEQVLAKAALFELVLGKLAVGSVARPTRMSAAVHAELKGSLAAAWNS